MIFLQLFWEFFKTGLFAVGGGLATLPFLKAITHKYPWFTANDLMDMIAVSESTPGPIGVNSATYAGFHAAGLPGALTATFSLVLPSVIIIILVSRALDRFRSSSLVQNGFYGLRPASAGLIFGAMFTVFAGSLLHLDLWSGPESLLSVLNYRAILLFLVLSVAIRKLPKVPVLSCSSAWAPSRASYSSSKESRKALFLLVIPSAEGKRFRRSGGLPPQAMSGCRWAGRALPPSGGGDAVPTAGAKGDVGHLRFPMSPLDPLLTFRWPLSEAFAAKRGLRGLGSVRRADFGTL